MNTFSGIFPNEGISCLEELFLLSESLSIPVKKILDSGLSTPWVNRDHHILPGQNYLLQTVSGDYFWFDNSGNRISHPGTLHTFSSHLVAMGSKRIAIPEGFTSIYRDTFYNSPVEEVTIPESIRTIQRHAFARCQNLKRIEIPPKVDAIENFAFENSGLESVVLGSGLRIVGQRIFCDCRNLRKVEILDGKLEILTWEMFAECRKLEEVSIPENVREIEALAFVGCLNLRKVRAPRHLREFFLLKSRHVLSNNMIRDSKIEFDFF